MHKIKTLNSEAFEVWNQFHSKRRWGLGQRNRPLGKGLLRVCRPAGPLGRYAHKFSFPQTSKDDIKAKQKKFTRYLWNSTNDFWVVATDIFKAICQNKKHFSKKSDFFLTFLGNNVTLKSLRWYQFYQCVN